MTQITEIKYCTFCGKELIKLGKYWICFTDETVTYNSVWSQMKDQWFLYVRYGLLIFWVGVGVGLAIFSGLLR